MPCVYYKISSVSHWTCTIPLIQHFCSFPSTSLFFSILHLSVSFIPLCPYIPLCPPINSCPIPSCTYRACPSNTILQYSFMYSYPILSVSYGSFYPILSFSFMSSYSILSFSFMFPYSILSFSFMFPYPNLSFSCMSSVTEVKSNLTVYKRFREHKTHLVIQTRILVYSYSKNYVRNYQYIKDG